MLRNIYKKYLPEMKNIILIVLMLFFLLFLMFSLLVIFGSSSGISIIFEFFLASVRPQNIIAMIVAFLFLMGYIYVLSIVLKFLRTKIFKSLVVYFIFIIITFPLVAYPSLLCSMYITYSIMYYIGHNPQDFTECYFRLDENRRNNCFERNAREAKNYLICNRITDDIKQYFCYQILAKEANDILICNNITDEWYRYDCLIHFYKDKDYQARKELCVNLTDGRTQDRCIANLAVDFSQAETCLELPRERPFTDDIKSIPRFTCLFDVAVKLEDENICDLIDEDNRVLSCKSKIKKEKLRKLYKDKY
jgi:hypothetical protein